MPQKDPHMASSADKSELDPRELADLSALADGSLDPAREQEVRDRIAAAPELTALYEREREVVSVLHAARTSDRAPLRLREAIEAARPSGRQRARRRVTLGGTVAAALAAVVLALVLILPGGTPGAPSVSQAAALAGRGIAAPAPGTETTAAGTKLDANLGDVYFPDWTHRFGWRAAGERTDTLGGRRAITVYYSWKGQRIAYTIVDAPALKRPAAAATRIGATEYQTLTLDGRQVVTWRRDGRTCVLSGAGVPASVLRSLASWSDAGS
jgi:hypothetical protein